MKTLAKTLGVARSNVIERRDGKRPRRGPQERAGDAELMGEIRRLVDERPTYGYRRIAALIKRARRADWAGTASCEPQPTRPNAPHASSPYLAGTRFERQPKTVRDIA